MLLSVESGPENRIFEIFLSTRFSKNAQRNLKFRGGNLPVKRIILKKKIFFHRNQRGIMIACHSFAKVFDLRFEN